MKTQIAIQFLEQELQRNIQSSAYEDFVINLRSLALIDPELARQLTEEKFGLTPSTRALLDYFTTVSKPV